MTHHVKNQRAVLRGAALALALATLAGCANHSERHFKVGSIPTTYKERHPIEIDEKEQTLDIPVATSSFGLTHATKASIDGFLTRYRQGASGVVTVMMPSGSPNENSARQLGNEIVETAVGAGIPRSRVDLVTYHAAEHGSTAPIRLSFTGVKASVKGCGRWDEDLAAPNTENKNFRNFGCATQANLAAQVANPSDLLNPQGMSGVDAQRRGVAIDEYRTGTVRTQQARRF